MKLLLENWRKHLKEESTLPTEGSAEATATYYAHVAGDHGQTGVEEFEAANDAAAIAKAEEEFGEDNQDNLKLLKISKLVKDFTAPAVAATATPGAPTAEQLYEKYWKKADPHAPNDDELAPRSERTPRSQEALQYSRAISFLKRLEENPSEEEIKKAILDGWDEGSYEYMDPTYGARD